MPYDSTFAEQGAGGCSQDLGRSEGGRTRPLHSRPRLGGLAGCDWKGLTGSGVWLYVGERIDSEVGCGIHLCRSVLIRHVLCTTPVCWAESCVLQVYWSSMARTAVPAAHDDNGERIACVEGYVRSVGREAITWEI